MASQTRFCLLSQPVDAVEFSTSPRRGPITRHGFGPAADAAGSLRRPFEPRAIVVGKQSRKCADISGVDWSGAAGHLSPRVELRSLDIDDRVRRARSEPPASLSTRLEVALAQQAFGVCADAGRRRLMAEPLSVPSRAEVASQSAKRGVMEGLLEKRHFHGMSPPGSALSPRIANRATAAVDIDAHAGRLHKKTIPSQGSLPHGESWDLQVGDGSEASFRRFIEQSLKADEYASLLGRPSSQSHPNHKLWELERGWNTYGSCRRSNSARPAPVLRQLSRVSSRGLVEVQESFARPVKSILAKKGSGILFSKQDSGVSSASTACSLDDFVEHSTIESPMPSPMESPCESDVDECASTCSEEKFAVHGATGSSSLSLAAAASEEKLPLSVRRVLSTVHETPGSSSLALAAAAAFRTSEADGASVVPILRRQVGLSTRSAQVANSSEKSSQRATWQ